MRFSITQKRTIETHKTLFFKLLCFNGDTYVWHDPCNDTERSSGQRPCPSSSWRTLPRGAGGNRPSSVSLQRFYYTIFFSHVLVIHPCPFETRAHHQIAVGGISFPPLFFFRRCECTGCPGLRYGLTFLQLCGYTVYRPIRIIIPFQ